MSEAQRHIPQHEHIHITPITRITHVTHTRMLIHPHAYQHTCDLQHDLKPTISASNIEHRIGGREAW